MAIKRSVNLCSVYILPLIGLNRYSFGEPTNFINCYLTPDRNLVVEVKTPVDEMESNHYYKLDMPSGKGTTYIVFDTPQTEEFQDTVEKFIGGKFSLFSDGVKDTIKKKSGFKWKVPLSDGSFNSARELLALDKHASLKKVWEMELGVVLPANAELMSIPDESNFLDLTIQEVSHSQ